MFDIFKEKEQPKIYIADFEISALIPGRGANKFDNKTIRLKQHPILISEGQIASENQKNRLFKSVYDRFINRSDFGKIKFKIVKMENLKYLSTISYYFNYDVD